MPVTIDPEPTTTTSARKNVTAGTCPFCGASLANPNACDRCDWVCEGHAQMGTQRNPRDTFAAVVSLMWPGAGHFYKGHVSLAVMFAALGVLCFLWSITFLMFFGFLSLPAFWIAVAAMAYFAPDLKHPAHAHPAAPHLDGLLH
jgi:TM2 domain-containing membrane protein YozV